MLSNEHVNLKPQWHIPREAGLRIYMFVFSFCFLKLFIFAEEVNMMLLAFYATLLMWVLNLGLKVNESSRSLIESVLRTNNLYDVFIIVFSYHETA